MATMHTPKAFYGRTEHSRVLALKGQVRYMTVRALKGFVDDLLAQDDGEAMIVDLRELEAIDSTGMGLLARLGRCTLQHGRRAVIVCGVRDVMTCLRSAAFDRLFNIVDEWPFDCETTLSEVPLETKELQPDLMGRLILEAHRDLASLSEENEQAFAGVISALEADLERKGRAIRD
ncbi:MAG TPA: STAS domain-containing protein [Polyangiaceae bacterium]|nr:STAS domain-containing protein [Polyangiaceae bacterium]